jgi:hypothetical protein
MFGDARDLRLKAGQRAVQNRTNYQRNHGGHFRHGRDGDIDEISGVIKPYATMAPGTVRVTTSL